MNKFFHKIKRELLADRRKFGALLGCCALGLLLWGRLLLKDIQRSAIAVPEENEVLVNSDKKRTDLKNKTQLPDLVLDKNVEKHRLKDALKRDIFDLKGAYLPKTEKNAKVTPLQPKLGIEVVDQADKARELVEQVCAEAAELRLQTIILGQLPGVIINERLFKQNDDIQGFSVEQITQEYVELRKQGILLRVRMSGKR